MTSRSGRWGRALGAVALVAAIGAPGSAPTAAQGTEPGAEQIVFVVHGLRANTGIVRGGIYAAADRWTQPGHQVAVCTARPTGGTARCTIRPPGPGRYAFAFFHDADGDQVLDRDLVGIPQEGYGFSNDVRPGLGAPPFESAAFSVAAGQTYQARVVVRYGWSP